jgi:hypothetical protein
MIIKTISKPKDLIEAEECLSVTQRARADTLAARDAARSELNGATVERCNAVVEIVDAANARLAGLRSAESECRLRLTQLRERHAADVSAAMVPVRHAAAERILTALETITGAGRDLDQTQREMSAAGVRATDWLPHNGGILVAVELIAQRIKAEEVRCTAPASRAA